MEDKKKQPSNKRGKERVQLDFTHEALERLDEIKDISGAASRAEAIRQSLRLYEWFVKETTSESTIVVQDEEGNTTTRFKAMLLHSALNIHPSKSVTDDSLARPPKTK